MDLTGDSAFLMQLLDDPWRWCQRHIQSLEFGSGQHVRATSRYQVEFPPDLVRGFLRGTRPSHVRALVPLATRPRRPLFNLDIRGPNGASAALLMRSSIAALQAEYLKRLVLTSPVAHILRPRLPGKLLEAICVFTPAVAATFEVGHDDGLASYLREGTGLPMTARQVRTWQTVLRSAAEALTGALDESAEALSSSEQVLLAIPRVEPLPRSVDEIDHLVHDYAYAVASAERAGDDALLRVLAEYGRRWEVIVETEVPLGRPSTITLSEDRPLMFKRRWFMQEVNAGDARSFHLEARSSDHSIEIATFNVRDAEGKVYGIPLLEGVRQTDESVALYSAEAERPPFAEVRLRLRPVKDVRATTWLLVGLVGLAIAGAALAPSGRYTVAVMQVVTLPATFAVALMLIREASPLAARLLRGHRVAVGLLTVILWIIAIWRALNGAWWV